MRNKSIKNEEVIGDTSAFPSFFRKRRSRILAADIWSFYRCLIKKCVAKKKENEALSFLEQAFDFYSAAEKQSIGSKPLLFYYSFLNLVKIALIIRKIDFPPVAKHGLYDPKENVRERLRLEGQIIKIKGLAQDHSEIFPEFVKILGGKIKANNETKIVELLGLIPSIHRAYVEHLNEKPAFLPITNVCVLKKRKNLWARLDCSKSDKDVRQTISSIRRLQSFKGIFHKAKSSTTSLYSFETDPMVFSNRNLDSSIEKLQSKIKQIGVWSILTTEGYRHYILYAPNNMLPQLACSYAVMFYLGSITRYKPYDFDKILSGKYGWIIQELLAAEPIQFIYLLASHLACADVIRPFTIRE